MDGVDLLRGLAICFVLMNHVNMQLLGAKVSYTQGLPRQLVSSLVWNGQFGVQIFFVISGFLITSTTLRRWGSASSVNLLDFYRLRFARISSADDASSLDSQRPSPDARQGVCGR
jgi:peptidoglycan/LPS O-acetylase OafA/YrhL